MAKIKLRKYECECDECDGVITYTKSDIEEESDSEPFDFKVTTVQYIICPNCGNKIVLSRKTKNYESEYLNKLERDAERAEYWGRNYVPSREDYYDDDDFDYAYMSWLDKEDY